MKQEIQMSNGTENAFTDPQLLIKKIKRTVQDGYMNREAEIDIEEFKIISAMMSSMLPKVSDESLFEVDDLIYPDDDTAVYKQRASSFFESYSEEQKRLVLEQCRSDYVEIYLFWVIFPKHQNPMSKTLDTTFLQLIEHKSSEFVMTQLATQLIRARTEIKLCLAIKLLNISLSNRKHDAYELLKKPRNYEYTLLYFKMLLNIPQSRHPQKNKIINWIISQSTRILKHFKNRHVQIPPYMKKVLKCDLPQEEIFDVKFVQKLVAKDNFYDGDFCFRLDVLYTFFMSAKTQEQKYERLKTFLIGINDKYNEHEKYESERLEKCSLFTDRFYRFVIDYLYFREYTKDHLRDIEKYYDYKIESYLSSPSDISNNELPYEDVNDLQISGDEIPDYTLERLTFYDQFMRHLHVINIVHTAFMMCPVLFDVKGDIMKIDSVIFRNEHDFKYDLNELFNHQQSRNTGAALWLFETILKNGQINNYIYKFVNDKLIFKIFFCSPFLILSKSCEYLKDACSKMLAGQKLDKMTEEELFYAINCTGCC